VGGGAPSSPAPVDVVSAQPGIDLDRLRTRLAAPLGCPPDALTVSLIAGGRSNLTYRLTDGQRGWVLRRPPLGHVLATAHDMSREYRVMSALGPVGIPVPRTILYEDDPCVIGAPFFVMEFVGGPVIRTEADARTLAPADAARAADDLVDRLAALHAVDPESAGLAQLGRPDGFLLRQIRRWRQQWHDSDGAARRLPLDGLADRLADRVPRSAPASVVHGDYRLDNTILAADDPGRVAAIIDWEMATLGDPLADLGLLLTYWSPVSARVTGSGHAVSANPGFPGADRLVARYHERTARGVDDIAWYEAFGHFKLAVIAQTIEARYRQGLTVGAEFETAGQAVPDLIERAGRLIS
jgi:aminoglycoside phosphotransferase (APT) family kinase protein